MQVEFSKPGRGQRCLIAGTDGGDQNHRRALKAPGDHRQHLGAGRVEPLRVIREQHQRITGRRGREQFQCSEGDEEQIGTSPRRHAERRQYRVPLGCRQAAYPFHEGLDDLVQTGEWQISLQPGTSDRQRLHPPPTRSGARGGQQARLAHARAAPHEQGRAAPRDAVQQFADGGKLAFAAEQRSKFVSRLIHVVIPAPRVS